MRRLKGRFAALGPRLMSNVRQQENIARVGLRSVLRTSFLAGGALAVLAFAFATLVVATSVGEGYGALLLAAPIAAALSGTLSWWALVARAKSHRLTRGVAAGVLAVLLSHYVCCYLFLLGTWLGLAAGTAAEVALPNRIGPVEAIAASAAFAWWSLVVLGWVTVPAGGLVGGILAVVHRRKPVLAPTVRPRSVSRPHFEDPNDSNP